MADRHKISVDIAFVFCFYFYIRSPYAWAVSFVQMQNVSRMFYKKKTLYCCSLLSELQNLRQNRSKVLRRDMKTVINKSRHFYTSDQG